MAVSDLTLVRHLIQVTEKEHAPLRWRRHGPGDFRAQFNGVRLSLSHAQFREGSLRCLSLSHGNERTLIEEPRNETLFGSKYRNEEDRLLAESLQLLPSVADGVRGRPLHPGKEAVLGPARLHPGRARQPHPARLIVTRSAFASKQAVEEFTRPFADLKQFERQRLVAEVRRYPARYHAGQHRQLPLRVRQAALSVA